MGITDKLKNIVNWESAIVIIFFFGCLTSIVIYGAAVQEQVLYIGGLVAMGIPTSFFGNLAARTTINSTNTKKENNTIEEVKVAIANLAKDIGDMKTEIAFMKIGITECDKDE